MEDLFDHDPISDNDPAIKRFYELAGRYPTFHLIMRVVQRHRRSQHFEQMEAPTFLREKDRELLQRGLDELAQAFPLTKDGIVSLPSVLRTLAEELHEPHEGGGNDG